MAQCDIVVPDDIDHRYDENNAEENYRPVANCSEFHLVDRASMR